MRRFFFALVMIALCTFADAQDKLFTLLPPEQTGVAFRNIVEDQVGLNVVSYEYYYNGGGVAVGDINNDGLPDLYFTSNVMECKLYLNQGDLKFKDITTAAGANGGGGYSTGAVMVDINNDGWQDIYLCKSVDKNPDKRANVLLINNKNNTFTNRAKDYGVNDKGFSMHATFNDMDQDGDLDLLVLNHPYNLNFARDIRLAYNKNKELEAVKDPPTVFESNRYYRNDNGKFTDITKAAGLETRSFGLSAILEDFNNDGLIDIYQANDYLEPDYLFINKGNNKFVEQHQKYFRHCSYSSMGSDYADLNNDGFSDLITTDMLPEGNTRQKQLRLGNNYDYFDKVVKYGFGHQYAKNVVQLNNGNGSYSDISYTTGMAFTDWSWATLINDFDNDGLKDVYIANGYMRDITDMDYVKFHMDSIQKELQKVKSNDEVISILTKIPSVKIKKGYFKNYGDLRFKREHKESGLDQFAWSFGAAYGDLDNDGDVEIIVNNSNDFAFIYKNNSIENKLGNAVRLQLVGPEKNINAIGSKIEVVCPDGLKIYQTLSPMKGYLSSRDLTQVIGIGKNTEAAIKIIWPDGKESVLEKFAAGALQKIQYPLMANIVAKSKNEVQFFKDYTSLINDINFEHSENEYIDFKLEPLLHRKFSHLGPSIAVGDINGDALEDVVIGGAKDRAAKIFVQTKNKFEELKSDALLADKAFEDGKVKLFDIDNDKDLDIMITSGGNDYPRDISKYPLRLYLNNGVGVFTKWNKLDYKVSAIALAMADYNKDGQVDVFVGGNTMPGAYGIVPASYLISISDKGAVEQKVFDNSKLGMISDASWLDVNGDTWLDLVMVGEWMPITIYYNKNGILSSEPFTITNSNGWWNTIKAADLDGDGDLDLVAGNIGNNTRYLGDLAHPVTMVSSDFDGNGSQESVINTFIKEQSYPIHIRDYMLDQMPYLRKKYLRYATYATAKLEDIFSAEQLAKAQSFKATQMNSCVYINNGNASFSEIPLPVQAQLFPINSIIIKDFDDDNKLDLLLAGNNYATEVETGRCDAGIGLYCKGHGNGKFTAIPTTTSTCYIPGDTRCMEPLIIGGKTYYVVGKNKDKLQLIGR